MRNPRNLDIRNQIREAGLYLWEISEEMKISENTLYRILRYDLSDLQRQKILNAINKLKNC